MKKKKRKKRKKRKRRKRRTSKAEKLQMRIAFETLSDGLHSKISDKIAFGKRVQKNQSTKKDERSTVGYFQD
jgi:hypothetical protein